MSVHLTVNDRIVFKDFNNYNILCHGCYGRGCCSSLLDDITALFISYQAVFNK